MKIEQIQGFIKFLTGLGGLYTGFILRDEFYYTSMEQYDDFTLERNKNLKIILEEKTNSDKKIKEKN